MKSSSLLPTAQIRQIKTVRTKKQYYVNDKQNFNTLLILQNRIEKQHKINLCGRIKYKYF